MGIKEKFEQDGFVVLEHFITESEADIIKNEATKLIQKIPQDSKRTVFSTVDSESQQNTDSYFLDSAHRISYFYEAGAIDANGELTVEPHFALNKIGHALHVLNPVFRTITFDERVKETIFQLGFADPAVVQSMYIFKNPGIGSEVTAHQDATYLHTKPVSVVGIWMALDDATVENGCLWFSKGSHKNDVHRRYILNPDKDSKDLLIYTSSAPYYQQSSFVPVPVAKGSCIVIHGQVVHYSPPNKSSGSRHAYTFHVIEQRKCQYSKSNWIQPLPEKPFLNLYQN